MATSAKRFGLDTKGDIELEIRLRRIESELSQLMKASDLSTDASTDTQRVSDIPQVTGLRVLGKTPGAITLAWNQVRISDLRRYELDIAEDLAFTTNKQTYNVAGTEYQFSTISTTGGGGATTIYARVRARSRNNVGPYSVTLDTTTGQAQSEDIADGAVTTIKISPSDPIEFDGLDDEDVGSKLALRGFQDGVTLSNNTTDSDHDIDISTGVVRDSTNILSISNSSVITKRLDAVWEAGDGAGGRASSVSLSASTPYFVFLLTDSTGTAVDAGFDTSPTAANLLLDTENLSLYRRRGCVVTDASSNIYPFHQYGDFFQYDNPENDPASYSSSAPPTGYTTHTLSIVPVGIECRVQLNMAWRPIGDNNWDSVVKYSSGHGNPGAGIDGGSKGDSRTVEFGADILMPTDATFVTYQAATHSNLRLYFQIHSWVDLRGKDGTL